jgi:tetratricopeptide (TPR) repeat protein
MRITMVAVCLFMAGLPPAAHGFDSPSAQGTPDLSAVRAKLKAGNYQAALSDLRLASQSYQHPDVYNLMGFALRKTGDPTQAAVWYRRALDADPNHKGALEYQGELFVQTGQMDKARENLARLTRLCPAGCEELTDLREAIEAGSKRR